MAELTSREVAGWMAYYEVEAENRERDAANDRVKMRSMETRPKG